jgi:hypothetical protein
MSRCSYFYFDDLLWLAFMQEGSLDLGCAMWAVIAGLV